MKTLKTILRPRVKWILSLSATIILALFCYGAFAQARRGDTHLESKDTSTTQQNPSWGERPDDLNENDPEFVKQRREWLDRFWGTSRGDAFVKAQTAAQTLPVSPLVGQWVFQSLSPMYNDYGGDPCYTPFPPNSPCGASARTDTIAVDPTNADTVYVGHEGGLARSLDAGAHWSYLSDSLPSQSIASILIDPSVNRFLYVGTGTNERFGAGIYRSLNGGTSWTVLGSQFNGSKVGKIVIDPSTAGSSISATLYASVTGSGSHSVWKSTNSGTSWTQIPIPGDTGNAGSFYDLAIDPRDPRFPQTVRTLYAAAPNGLFKTTDGGVTWSASIHPRGTPPLPNKPACLAFVQGTLYFAFQECVGPSPCTNRVIVAYSRLGGSDWTEKTPTNGGLYFLGVDPVHPNRIFVGGGGELRYSLDGAVNWLTTCVPGTPCIHPDMHSIAFCPSNTERNYLGTDGGIYRSDNGGSGNPIVWYSKNENLPGSLMYGLSISSDSHIVMGNQDNGSQVGWVGQIPPWKFPYYNAGGDGFKPKIDQNNSNKLYYQNTSYVAPVCQQTYPILNRVVDGQWANIVPSAACGEAASFFVPLYMAAADSARIITGFKNIYRSVNSGDSWTRIGPTNIDSGTATAVYEAPSDTNVIYAVFDTSRLRVTSTADQGNNAAWTNRTPGLPGGIQAITVNPVNPQVAYAACNSTNSGLYRTMDMGQHWTRLGPFANLGCWDLAIDPAATSHLFAATGSGVYMSTDAGTSWASTVGIPAGMAVTSLSLNATSRKLAASTYGRGVYMLDLSQ
jgi:photosystem II stability/assembly factor-like uncharacterized protein